MMKPYPPQTSTNQDSLWNADRSLDANLIPRFEGQDASCIDVSQQLAVSEPHPVGAALLLPVGLDVQVMESIIVHLWRDKEELAS